MSKPKINAHTFQISGFVDVSEFERGMVVRLVVSKINGDGVFLQLLPSVESVMPHEIDKADKIANEKAAQYIPKDKDGA